MNACLRRNKRNSLPPLAPGECATPSVSKQKQEEEHRVTIGLWLPPQFILSPLYLATHVSSISLATEQVEKERRTIYRKTKFHLEPTTWAQTLEVQSIKHQALVSGHRCYAPDRSLSSHSCISFSTCVDVNT